MNESKNKLIFNIAELSTLTIILTLFVVFFILDIYRWVDYAHIFLNYAISSLICLVIHVLSIFIFKTMTFKKVSFFASIGLFLTNFYTFFLPANKLYIMLISLGLSSISIVLDILEMKICKTVFPEDTYLKKPLDYIGCSFITLGASILLGFALILSSYMHIGDYQNNFGAVFAIILILVYSIIFLIAAGVLLIAGVLMLCFKDKAKRLGAIIIGLSLIAVPTITYFSTVEGVHQIAYKEYCTFSKEKWLNASRSQRERMLDDFLSKYDIMGSTEDVVHSYLGKHDSYEENLESFASRQSDETLQAEYSYSISYILDYNGLHHSNYFFIDFNADHIVISYEKGTL